MSTVALLSVKLLSVRGVKKKTPLIDISAGMNSAMSQSGCTGDLAVAQVQQ